MIKVFLHHKINVFFLGPHPLFSSRLDVVLDTPVVVMPRSATSSEVLVAHLGKISVNNIIDNSLKNVQDSQEHLWGLGQSKEQYNIEIRDMNLFSLNTEKTIESARKQGGFPGL